MTETFVERPVRIFLSAAVSMAFFSVMNVFVKLSSADYSMAQIVFFRSVVAFVPILYMILRSRDGLGLLKTERHAGHFFRGLIGIVAMLCFFKSFALLPLTTATAIHFAGPLMLTALSVPLLSEKVGPYRWGAVIVGLCAVLFMIRPTHDGTSLAGSLIALLAAFFAALAMISVRKLGKTEHALTIVFYFTLYGALLGGLGMIFTWQPLRAESIIFLVMTGLFGGFGQVTMTYAYANAPAAYVAPFSYLVMLFSVVSDIALWGLWPDWHVLAGSPIVIASGLFIVWREARRNQVNIRANIYALQPVTATERDAEQG